MAGGAGPQPSLPLLDTAVRVLSSGFLGLEPEGKALGPSTTFEDHNKIYCILREYLQPENHKGFTADVVDTARRIADLIPPLVGEEEGEYVWAVQAMYLAIYMFGLARQIPHHHPSQERLVQLLLRLGDCNKMLREVPETGKGVKRSWNDRTILLGKWDEWYENGRNYITIGGMGIEGVPGTEPSEDINGHAFMARLIGGGYGIIGLPNAIYSLRDYLEEPEATRDAYSETPSDAGYEATIISCMSMWFIYGGQQLFNRIVLNKYREDDDHPNLYIPGELFNGPDWRLGRWRFWQHRLATFATSELNDVNAEAVDLATRASDLMLAIEKAMTF